MINLKKLFYPNKRMIAVSKSQKEVLECFIANRSAFEEWCCFQQETKISFKFYYPTAIDFYYENYKLFTAYYKKSQLDVVELQEFKMTEDNYRSIRSTIWKPFEEIMLQFLNNLDEQHKGSLFQKRRALYEYADICKGNTTVQTPEQYYLLKEQLQ